jgi:hypothetical protein
MEVIKVHSANKTQITNCRNHIYYIVTRHCKIFFQYSYYSCEQVVSCAKAEFVATYGFDMENAINIAYYLWHGRKQRLPSTRMFTKSSVPYSNYVCEVDFQTLQ